MGHGLLLPFLNLHMMSKFYNVWIMCIIDGSMLLMGLTHLSQKHTRKNIKIIVTLNILGVTSTLFTHICTQNVGHTKEAHAPITPTFMLGSTCEVVGDYTKK